VRLDEAGCGSGVERLHKSMVWTSICEWLTFTASQVDMRERVRASNTCKMVAKDGVRVGRSYRETISTLASVSHRTTPGNSLVVLKAAAASGEPYGK
jgi:hypothetical protein